METPQNLLGSLRREVALDIRDHQDQNPQQHHDLNDVVEEELDAAADPACGIQTAGFHNAADQPVQPFHTKDFVLKNVPPCFQRLHNCLLVFQINQEILI